MRRRSGSSRRGWACRPGGWGTADASFSLLRGTGSGAFAPKVEYTVDRQPEIVTLGDLNADGILDFLSASRVPDTVNSMDGDGTGFTSPGGVLFPGANPIGVAIGDVSSERP